jgi:hypothetical protein
LRKEEEAQRREGRKGTYIFDLFDAKVGICGDSDGFWTDIDYDHDRSGDVPFKEIVDFLV